MKNKKPKKKPSAKQIKPQFFNRELSWINFNRRVLHEALRADNPLLERLKFLSIVSSNFDEFFMVRFASVRRQRAFHQNRRDLAGMTPTTQLREITRLSRQTVAEQYDCLNHELLPLMADAGIRVCRLGDFDEAQLQAAETSFEREIFPNLTPLRLPPTGPAATLANLQLHLAFSLRSPEAAQEERQLAVVPVPLGLERVRVAKNDDDEVLLTLLEDLILASGQQLFRGYQIVDAAPFRITRDADMAVDEEADDDFVDAMAEVLVSREHSSPVRLEIAVGHSWLRDQLAARFKLSKAEIYEIDGPLDLKSFMGVALLKGFDHLRNAEWEPQPLPALDDDDVSLWDLIRSGDLLLHHPYDSFETVVRMVSDAADDPRVLAIKMTLYRTSGGSPIIAALKRAAANGKHVAVLVELKARFDEGRNIDWAQQLERVGVIVIHGVAQLKVHAKALLIVRREADGIRRYAHLGTGNYNDKTARLYTDMGLMTARPELTYDVILFFNAITGYTAVPPLRKLLMAPHTMKDRFIHFIEREAERCVAGSTGLIMAKVNSLADADIIKALYRASSAGVEILLNVRGICMLVPGVKGMSERITVVSIIDRFLEHSRVIYFENGGNNEIYMGSADWMSRNLDRRIELMFPVEDARLQRRLVTALKTFFSDNTNSHRLLPDGSYDKAEPEKGEKRVRCQQVFCTRALRATRSKVNEPKRLFNVRRHAPKSK